MEQRELIELCCQLIRIDSINPFRWEWRDGGQFWIDGNEGEILEFCENFLREAGFHTERQDCGGGRQNLLAEKGDGPRSLLLYGHLDTVEVKPGWSYSEALTPRIDRIELADGRREEVLFGLGSNDMKGGLAVILAAASTAVIDGYKLKVALGCDEEFWSLGSYVLVNSPFMEDVELILIPEVGESGGRLGPDEIGVTLGRCGRVEFEIEFFGTGGHGAEPYRSDRLNPISAASEVALKVEELSRSFSPIVPFSGGEELRASALVTLISGGEGTLSIPSRARLVVNRVLLPGEGVETARSELESILSSLPSKYPILSSRPELSPQIRQRPRPTPALMPYLMDPEAPLVSNVLRVVGEFGRPVLQVGVSVADENRFAVEGGKTAVVLGPVGENSHAPYEWVSIPSLYRCYRIYRRICENFKLMVNGE